jgi:DNA-binding MarR family transcriptional regulator
LQLVSAVEAMPSIEDFDANEKALFDSLILAWSQGAPLTLRGAINQANLGSPATLHKRLQRLIAKDLIVAEFEDQDRRTKYLRPSEKGLVYIEWLSSQMTTVQLA